MRWLFALVFFASCAPPATSEGQLPPADGRGVWVLVVHGSGDTPGRWAEGLIERLRPQLALPSRTVLVAYDWAEAAQDKLAAPGNGQAEGRALAQALVARGATHVHVIAHSAGAHVAYGVELGLEEVEARPTLHLTLLDPFLGMGLDFEWGASRFGAKADFVEQYLNAGDGVPGTDVAVKAAHVFDVSALKPAGMAAREGHWWPTSAYQEVEPGAGNSLEVSGVFDAEVLRGRWPAGVTEVR